MFLSSSAETFQKQLRSHVIQPLRSPFVIVPINDRLPLPRTPPCNWTLDNVCNNDMEYLARKCNLVGAVRSCDDGTPDVLSRRRFDEWETANKTSVPCYMLNAAVMACLDPEAERSSCPVRVHDPSTVLMSLIDLALRSRRCLHEHKHDRTNSSCPRMREADPARLVRSRAITLQSLKRRDWRRRP